MTSEEIQLAFRDYIWNSDQPTTTIKAEENAFKAGVKWAAERLYTKEDMESMYCIGLLNKTMGMDSLSEDVKHAQEKIDLALKFIGERKKK